MAHGHREVMVATVLTHRVDHEVDEQRRRRRTADERDAHQDESQHVGPEAVLRIEAGTPPQAPAAPDEEHEEGEGQEDVRDGEEGAEERQRLLTRAPEDDGEDLAPHRDAEGPERHEVHRLEDRHQDEKHRHDETRVAADEQRNRHHQEQGLEGLGRDVGPRAPGRIVPVGVHADRRVHGQEDEEQDRRLQQHPRTADERDGHHGAPSEDPALLDLVREDEEENVHHDLDGRDPQALGIEGQREDRRRDVRQEPDDDRQDGVPPHRHDRIRLRLEHEPPVALVVDDRREDARDDVGDEDRRRHVERRPAAEGADEGGEGGDVDAEAEERTEEELHRLAAEEPLVDLERVADRMEMGRAVVAEVDRLDRHLLELLVLDVEHAEKPHLVLVALAVRLQHRVEETARNRPQAGLGVVDRDAVHEPDEERRHDVAEAAAERNVLLREVAHAQNDVAGLLATGDDLRDVLGTVLAVAVDKHGHRDVRTVRLQPFDGRLDRPALAPIDLVTHQVDARGQALEVLDVLGAAVVDDNDGAVGLEQRDAEGLQPRLGVEDRHDGGDGRVAHGHFQRGKGLETLQGQ